MIVNKITPQGFCGGVTNALKILDKALLDNSLKKPIYMLGQIIHNTHIIDEYRKKGVIILDDKTKSRLELLSEINEGTVVFSAHGVSPIFYEIAADKGLDIIDTTCPYVKIVKDHIKEYIEKDYTIVYIGTKGHPECEGILGLSKDIILISNIDDIMNKYPKKLYATNQTTLSIYDIKDIYEKLKKIYPDIIIDDKICNATTVRQKALANQTHVDLCIIVGDKLSSNTKKLYSVSKNISKCETLLVDNLKELKKYDLSSITSASVSSGASTPSYLVDEIIDYLNNYN